MLDGVEIRCFRWEKGRYFSAHDTFQKQIPETPEFDLVVGILWSRLGMPPPEGFPEMKDGRRYPSGTAYELLTAIEHRRRQQEPPPDILVYRKTTEPPISATDSEKRREQNAQLDMLDSFLREWFFDKSAGFKAAFQTFETADDFEALFEANLLTWLEENHLLGRERRWRVEEKGPPFCGLESFGARHREVFFGRRADTERARERLDEASRAGIGFLLIEGASGSGKSSLARASLLPRLQDLEPDRRVAIALPQAQGLTDPVQALAAAMFRETALPELAEGDFPDSAALAEHLSAGGGPAPVLRALDRASTALQAAEDRAVAPEIELVLLIDQLEQLFGRSVSADQRSAFATTLDSLARSGRVRVVTTLRANALGAALELPALAGLIDAGARLSLAAPGPEALSEIVRGPAEAAALAYERDGDGHGLDEVLIRDTSGTEALPLLQFALEQLYRSARNRLDLSGGRLGDVPEGAPVLTLTFADYDNLGGLSGAIGRHAEQAVADLPGSVQGMLPRLVRALTEGSAGAPVLRAAGMNDAVPTPEGRQLAEALVEARILVRDGESLRIAHETALTAWSRAAQALEEAKTFLRVRAEIERAEARWRAGGKRADLLLPPGVRLAEAETVLRDHHDELPVTLHAFVAASGRRARLRQRLTAAAAVVFAGIAGVAVWFFYEAMENARIANLERARAEAGEQKASVAQAEAEHESVRARRNLDLAFQATDDMALDIARELETNFHIPVADKLFFARRLDQSFGKLLSLGTASSGLELRHAELLASFSLMLFDAGHHGLAQEYSHRADVTAASVAENGPPENEDTGLTLARVRLAHALGRFYGESYWDAGSTLDEIAAMLEEIERTAGRPETALEAAYLRARTETAQIQFQRTTLRQNEAGRIEWDTRKRLVAMLDDLSNDRSSDTARRKLYTQLLQIHVERYLIGVSDQTESDADAFRAFRKDLDAARPLFGNGVDPAWQFFDAWQQLTAASFAFQNGRRSEALERMSLAIDGFQELSIADRQNLRWRRDLAYALLKRAQYASISGNRRQAETDLATARSLAIALYRDDASPYHAARLSSAVDLVAAQAAGTDSRADRLEAYSRVIARSKWLISMIPTPTIFNDWMIRAHQGLLDAHREDGEWPEALDNAEMALDLLAENEAAVGVQKNVLSLRNYVLTAALQMTPADVGEKKWGELFALAEQNLDRLVRMFPDAGGWNNDRAFLMGLKARHLAADGLYAEAIRFYEAAIKAQLQAMTTEPNWKASELIYYAREMVEARATLGDFHGVLQTARLLRDTVSADLPLGDNAAVLGHWEAYVAVLKSIATREGEPSGDRDRKLQAALEQEATVAHETMDRLRSASADAERKSLLASVAPLRSLDFRKTDLGGTTRDGSDALEPGARLGWSFKPLYPAVWRSLIGEEFEQARQLFLDTLDSGSVEVRHIRHSLLSFYDAHALLEAELMDANGEIDMATILVADDTRFLLDGTSPPIHEANELLPLDLSSASNAAAYLRFFGAYVRGEEGPFLIVDSVDDLPWLAEATPKQKQHAASVIRPLVLWQDPTLLDGHFANGWLAAASINYGNAIFSVIYRIGKDGLIEMLESNPVATDLQLDPSRYTGGTGTRKLNLSLIGEEMAEDEAQALLALALLPADTRPAHYPALAELALALKQAGEAELLSQLPFLRRATNAHYESGSFGDAYRIQQNIVHGWETLLTEVEEGHPQLPASFREYARDQARLAHLALLSGDREAAVRNARAAVNRSPDDRWAAMQLAHALAAQGDRQSALRIYEANAGETVAGIPWLHLAFDELGQIRAQGNFYGQLVRFNGISIVGTGPQTRESGAAEPFMADFDGRREGEYPSLFRKVTSEIVERLETMLPEKERRFDRVDFLFGGGDSVIVVIPYDLPHDPIIYIDWFTIAFEAQGQILADMPVLSDTEEVRHRLLASEKVGLVFYQTSMEEFPQHITHIATVVRGRPDFDAQP